MQERGYGDYGRQQEQDFGRGYGDYGRQGYGIRQGRSRSEYDERMRGYSYGEQGQQRGGMLAQPWTYTETWIFTGPFTGRGPRGYQRSDDRLWEDVCECLTQLGRLDASEIDVKVNNGEVTLTGTVSSREEKRMAEDAVDSVPGVQDVRNELRVSTNGQRGAERMSGTSSQQPQRGGQTTQSTQSQQRQTTARSSSSKANQDKDQQSPRKQPEQETPRPS
jgi:hypothetical protein